MGSPNPNPNPNPNPSLTPSLSYSFQGAFLGLIQRLVHGISCRAWYGRSGLMTQIFTLVLLDVIVLAFNEVLGSSSGLGLGLGLGLGSP